MKTKKMKTLQKNTFAFVLAIATVLGSFWMPQMSLVVRADADPVQYIDASGDTQSHVATPLSEDTTAWGTEGSNTWYVTSAETTTINLRVTVTGNVSLILRDGSTLEASDGITVSSGNSLTIYAQSAGTGSLVATTTGDLYSAAIGGNGANSSDIYPEKDCGTITINGGNITAEAYSTNGAGIGGGYNGSGGTITINGGVVHAKAIGNDEDSNGAGIGGGYNGSGGTITINGGIVNAEATTTKPYRYYSYGAGIGSGKGGDGGSVTINCVGVSAIGGSKSGLHPAQGIGKGYSNTSSTQPGSLTVGSGVDMYGGDSSNDMSPLARDAQNQISTRKRYMKTCKPLSSVTVGTIADQTYTGSAIVPTLTVTDGTETLTKDQDYTVSCADNVNVGTATVTLTGEGKYAGTKQVAFTITPAAATVTASNASKSYGAADPELTATVSGTLGADTLTYSVSRATGEAVGTYTITPTGETTQGNYTVSYVPGTFTIQKASNPATVTSTASVTKGGHTVDLSSNVNGAVGTVSYAISGEANGCTLNGSVLTSGSNAGTVTVNVSIAEDGNYRALAATPITVTIADLTQEITPTATFTATGSDCGTLSNVENGMKYSLNGGSNWTDITASSVTISSGITAANGIKVKRAGNGTTTTDSDPQTITVTQPNVPTAGKTDCTTADNNDGKLTGVTTAMEYKKSDAASWTDGTGNDVTGLTPGTYYVRIKASGTALASVNQVLTIAAYTDPSSGGSSGSTEPSSGGNSGSTEPSSGGNSGSTEPSSDSNSGGTNPPSGNNSGSSGSSSGNNSESSGSSSGNSSGASSGNSSFNNSSASNTTTSTTSTTSKDGSKTETVTITDPATGQVTETATTKKKDGTKVVEKTVTNQDGSEETVKTVTKKDGTSKVKDTVISSDGAKTVAVAEKTKDETSIRTATYDSDGGLTAKATYSPGSGSNITLTKVETSETKASIPSEVKIGNKTYKVTKISADALSEAKNLKTIGINGKNLKQVEEGAFANINPKATIKIKASKMTYQKVVKMIKGSGVPETVKFKRIK